MSGAWVVLDVGEVLIDETRVWAVWADVLGTTPLTLAASLGASIASGGAYGEAVERLHTDWRGKVAEAVEQYGAFRPTDLYPDALPTVRALQTRHDVSLAVIGNQPARRHDELVDLGIHPPVMAMSETMGVAKPDPAFFAQVLARCGNPDPAAVTYVGDRLDNDIAPALAAGLQAVHLRRGPWALLQERPDITPTAVLDALADLPAWLDARAAATA